MFLSVPAQALQKPKSLSTSVYTKVFPTCILDRSFSPYRSERLCRFVARAKGYLDRFVSSLLIFFVVFVIGHWAIRRRLRRSCLIQAASG